MDFMNDLYEMMGDSISIESVLAIAQEAEDITGEAEAAAADATGKKEVGNEIDTNTDDILGTKTPDNEDGTTEDNPDDNPGDENTDPTGEGGEDTEDGPPDSDNEDDQMQEDMKEQEDPFEASRKKKLWLQFKTLHKSLGDSINLISEHVPHISDAPTIKTIANIKENLIDARDYVYRLLTEEYKELNYPKMQQRFIGVNNIYDICSNELEEYFSRRKK